ncbi:DUF2530 domain-containing protein [Agromyces protaetiae]|uniref:DUF2530 domain-containing protein n=1 Tax=Agromyces protaetiae TaxID=2509455 RepID=A0A4P6FBF8_9MICO|nr:DUF2530 domain-containing protein [Agromyces protaetiae]QAY73322.1 DUF2530 domain-containing protein [Agromyces protaetiae]
MRFWLSEEERRPDPAPARADARKALFAGTILWIVALAVFWWFREPLGVAGFGWFVPASIVGVALGVAGLVVVQVRRRGAASEAEPDAADAQARDGYPSDSV